MTLERIIRLRELLQLTGLSRPTLYRLIAQERFPRSVHLTPRLVGWRSSSVQAWLDSLAPVTAETEPETQERPVAPAVGSLRTPATGTQGKVVPIAKGGS